MLVYLRNNYVVSFFQQLLVFSNPTVQPDLRTRVLQFSCADMWIHKLAKCIRNRAIC
uniref:Uncharacterized protein n=1 Tax=Oryza brachyantha TaxID=4533 RepID=J3MNR7_ORYBR